MSRKGSDYCAIPLCRIHHTEIHAKGVAWFEDTYAVVVDRLIVATLIGFITGTGKRSAR